MRIASGGENVPKPLLRVGDKLMLEHIMEQYASHGVTGFILCLGYEGEKIRFHFFRNPSRYNVEMVDTGEDASKAERLLRVRDLVEDVFFVSYGDDLADVDISKLLEMHKTHGKIATLSAVKLPNPYGILELDDFEPYVVSDFKEKPIMDNWVNGGYFVFNKEIFDYIKEGDDLEKEVFRKLISEKKIAAYRHSGFWKSMNTIKDHLELNEMFNNGQLNLVLKKQSLER